MVVQGNNTTGRTLGTVPLGCSFHRDLVDTSMVNNTQTNKSTDNPQWRSLCGVLINPHTGGG